MTGIDRAARAAGESTLRFRVGASMGWIGVCNIRKTHPKLKAWGYPEWANLHAEANLVLTAGEDLMGAWVHVARLSRKGEWALAKPCPWCMALLLHSGVRGVRWTVGPGKIEEVKF